MHRVSLAAGHHTIYKLPPCSHFLGVQQRLLGAHARRRAAIRASAHDPYPNIPGGTPQEHLLRQTALQSVWSARLSSAAVTLGRLAAAARSFLLSCRDVLPLFTVLSPQQALRRMLLILAASLLMVVIITTIDSGLLYTYVRSARRLA